MKNILSPPVLAAALVAAAVAAQVPSITSTWKNQDIAIDGAIKKWPVLTPLPDGMAVAASNDADNLYLAIVTSDLDRLRQIGTVGLVVWFDPAGGTKEVFGIRVPAAGTARPGDRFAGAGDDQPSRDRPQPKVTWVELMGPGKNDLRRIELAAEDTIAAAAANNDGTMLIELKVPIGTGPKDFPFGIGATLDRPLGLEIEAPKTGAQYSGSINRGGGGGFGGRGGRGGYGGGGYGGGNQGMSRGSRSSKELKIWTTLTLAKS